MEFLNTQPAVSTEPSVGGPTAVPPLLTGTSATTPTQLVSPIGSSCLSTVSTPYYTPNSPRHGPFEPTSPSNPSGDTEEN